MQNERGANCHRVNNNLRSHDDIAQRDHLKKLRFWATLKISTFPGSMGIIGAGFCTLGIGTTDSIIHSLSLTLARSFTALTVLTEKKV